MASAPHAVETLQDPTAPLRKRWSRDAYHRAGDAGVFAPEERVELIGGDIVWKMTPQKTPHATALRLGEEILRRLFPAGHDVRTHLPLALAPDSEPEPDLAVVAGGIRDYEEEHPSTAVLVVEIADTTLRFDRTIKAGLYASAGIPEYWIVNLTDRVVECHRDPAPMADQPFSHHYRSITRHPETDAIAPLARDGGRVTVADLLPRPTAERG